MPAVYVWSAGIEQVMSQIGGTSFSRYYDYIGINILIIKLIFVLVFTLNQLLNSR